MEVSVEYILENISKEVLGERYDAVKENYMFRLKVLYELIIQEAHESGNREEYSELLLQIIQFEKSGIYGSVLELSKFQNMTIAVVLESISEVAFGLAVGQLMGKSYEQLAGGMSEVFDALLLDGEFATDELKSKYKMLISETILDLQYAAGKSKFMSLRLKQQRDYSS